MRRDQTYQAAVIAVGIAASAIFGAMAAPGIGGTNAMIWAALLTYVFALAYGANRLQVWLARPPIVTWKAAILGAVSFIPMFLGYFPASNWNFQLGFTIGWKNLPSPWAIVAVMLFGLFVPGGVLFTGWRNLTGDHRPPG